MDVVEIRAFPYSNFECHGRIYTSKKRDSATMDVYKYPIWPLPHQLTGCVPVTEITLGANLPTKA